MTAAALQHTRRGTSRGPAASAERSGVARLHWWLLFVLGMSSTLYIELIRLESTAVKLVILTPWLLLLPTLVTTQRTRGTEGSLWLWLPLTWLGYIVVRQGQHGSAAMMDLARAGTNIVAFYVALKLIRTSGTAQGLFAGLSAGILASIFCAAARLNVLGKETVYYGIRWQGFFEDPNYFANGVGLVFVGGICLLLQPGASLRVRMMALALTVATAVGIWGSGSRGALAMSAASIAVPASLMFTGGKLNFAALFRSALGAVVALVIMFAIVYSVRHYLPDRVRDFVEGNSGYEDDPRHDIMISSLEAIRSSPLIGIGPEARYLDNGDGRYQSSHNIVLFTLCWSGGVGAVLFFAIPALGLSRCLAAMRRGLSPQDLVPVSQAVSVVGFVFLHGMTVDNAEAVHLWLALAMLSGVASLQSPVARQRHLAPRTTGGSSHQRPAIRPITPNKTITRGPRRPPARRPDPALHPVGEPHVSTGHHRPAVRQ